MWSIVVKEGKYQERTAAFLNTLSHEDIAISALGPGQGKGAGAICQCVRIGKQVKGAALVYALQDGPEGLKRCK